MVSALSYPSVATAHLPENFDEDLVVDARACLSPAEMVDEKLYSILGAAHNARPSRDNRNTRGGRPSTLRDR